MEFRKAVPPDKNQIMSIIDGAKKSLKEQGINQWQDHYPNLKTIHQDITDQTSYILIEDQEIKAIATVSFEGEKTYDQIYEGEWLTQGDFAVIHRFAVKQDCKRTGVATLMMDHIAKLCIQKHFSSIKVDTHEQNLPMQNLLIKHSFVPCGIIYLEDGSKRVAFEKVLNRN